MAAITDMTKIADSPRSRRSLLAGVLGGLGAWAASAASRLDPAQAAAGDPIRMGQFNKAGGTSTALQTGSSGAALRVIQLQGGSAVRAQATSGRAVQALAGRGGTGVWTYSPNHYGVHAHTDRGVAIRAFATPDGHALRVDGRAVMTDTWVAGRLRTSWGVFIDRNSDPVHPNTNQARLFARDNGLGKTQLCVEFPGGDIQVLATQA
jgi:hypothetical protein